MGAAARASVYERKLVLESGSGQVEAAPGYVVEAGTLRIAAEQPGTLARIGMREAGRLTVAAFRGSVRVTNATGLLVAKVEAGSSLDFEPQAAGAAAPTQAAGCLLVKEGKFIMAEQTTSIVLELRGAALNQELGNRVQITGRAMHSPAPAGGAGQVIAVIALQRLAKGGCTAVAKKLGAAIGIAAAETAVGGTASGSAAGGAAAGAATTAGIGAGTVAVIGGVAAVATVGGLAAVGSLPGQSDAPPVASR